MREEIYTAYAEQHDITFIMKDTFDRYGNPYKTEVIGWYYGEPDDESTRQFSGSLIAEYK